MSAPPEGFRPKCTACGGEKFTPSGVCLDCPHDFEAMAGSADHCKHCEVEFMQHGKAKGCGKCGREACPTRPMRLGELPLITTTAYLDCANAALEAEREKSARLAGELEAMRSDNQELLANADADAMQLGLARRRADKAERALAAVLYVVEAGNRWAADGTNSQRRVDLREALFAYKIAAKGVAAATDPAEVARVTATVDDIDGDDMIALGFEGCDTAVWIKAPRHDRKSGDAVTVTVRKG